MISSVSKKMRKLWLSGQGLNGKILEKMGKHLKNLEVLNLNKNPLEEKYLIHLKKLDSMEELYLKGTTITDQAVPYLKSLKNLKFLSIKNTQISTDKIEELQSNLQQTKIFHDEK